MAINYIGPEHYKNMDYGFGGKVGGGKIKGRKVDESCLNCYMPGDYILSALVFSLIATSFVGIKGLQLQKSEKVPARQVEISQRSLLRFADTDGDGNVSPDEIDKVVMAIRGDMPTLDLSFEQTSYKGNKFY